MDPTIFMFVLALAGSMRIKGTYKFPKQQQPGHGIISTIEAIVVPQNTFWKVGVVDQEILTECDVSIEYGETEEQQ